MIIVNIWMMLIPVWGLLSVYFGFKSHVFPKNQDDARKSLKIGKIFSAIFFAWIIIPMLILFIVNSLSY